MGGIGFVAASLAVNWPFAYFLMSPGARNWVFAMNEFGYKVPPSRYHLAWELQSYEKTQVEFWVGMLVAVVATVLSVRIGMLWANWMGRVRR
jgi:ABC-type spermidine/putrescine transport system permease subunit II